MTILTDEIVEKAARAMQVHDAEYVMALQEAGVKLDEGSPLWTKHKIMARAALQAVLPDVVGDAWQAAINLVVLSGPPGSDELRNRLIENMQARIRSLLNKEDNANG